MRDVNVHLGGKIIEASFDITVYANSCQHENVEIVVRISLKLSSDVIEYFKALELSHNCALVSG